MVSQNARRDKVARVSLIAGYGRGAGHLKAIRRRSSVATRAVPDLDAVAQLRSTGGARTMPIARLLIPPSDDHHSETVLEAREIITGIEISTSQPIVSTYRKAMDRAAWSFALVGVAVTAQFAGDRRTAATVVLSGVANTPRAATAGEEVLVRIGDLESSTIEQAATAAANDAQPLSRNGYKRQLVVAVTRDALTRPRPALPSVGRRRKPWWTSRDLGNRFQRARFLVTGAVVIVTAVLGSRSARRARPSRRDTVSLGPIRAIGDHGRMAPPMSSKPCSTISTRWPSTGVCSVVAALPVGGVDWF